MIKLVLTQKQMMTSDGRAEHPLADQNTQHLSPQIGDWPSIKFGWVGGGPTQGYFFQNVHQLRANDCQNCGLWAR